MFRTEQATNVVSAQGPLTRRAQVDGARNHYRATGLTEGLKTASSAR